jgi:Glyoxalase/Bleomycin resistance protein/Dioxygenase superfamily
VSGGGPALVVSCTAHCEQQPQRARHHMALQILGTDHVALTISDPNRSARFYEEILGMPASSESPQVRWISCGTSALVPAPAPAAHAGAPLLRERRLWNRHCHCARRCVYLEVSAPLWEPSLCVILQL